MPNQDSLPQPVTSTGAKPIAEAWAPIEADLLAQDQMDPILVSYMRRTFYYGWLIAYNSFAIVLRSQNHTQLRDFTAAIKAELDAEDNQAQQY